MRSAIVGGAIAAVACAIAVGAGTGVAVAEDNPIAAWSRTKAMAQHGDTEAEKGAAVFNNWCSACHSHDTARNNAPGTRSLEFKYHGEIPAALEDRNDLSVELVKHFVRNGVATMPFFRPTEISNEDLDALAAYLAKQQR
jgi:mono/diheme cytochrome c family protein